MRHRSLEMPTPSKPTQISLKMPKEPASANVVTNLHEKLAGLEQKYNQFVGQCAYLLPEKQASSTSNYTEDFLSTFKRLSPDRSKSDPIVFDQLGQTGIQKLFKKIVKKIDLTRERMIEIRNQKYNYREEITGMFGELKEFIWQQIFKKSEGKEDTLSRNKESLKSIETVKQMNEKIEELKDLLNKKKLENIKLEYRVQQYQEKLEAVMDENRILKSSEDNFSRTLPKSRVYEQETRHKTTSPAKKPENVDLKYDLERTKEELKRVREERNSLKSWKENTSTKLIQDYENEKSQFQIKLNALQKRLLGFSKVAQNLVEDSFRRDSTFTSGDWGDVHLKTQEISRTGSITRSGIESPLMSPLESPKNIDRNSKSYQFEFNETNRAFARTSNSFIKKPERGAVRSNKPPRKADQGRENTQIVSLQKQRFEDDYKILKQNIPGLLENVENYFRKQFKAISKNLEDKMHTFESSHENIYKKLQVCLNQLISLKDFKNQSQEYINSLEKKIVNYEIEIDKYNSKEENLRNELRDKNSEINKILNDKTGFIKKYQESQKNHEYLEDSYKKALIDNSKLKSEISGKNEDLIEMKKKYKEEQQISSVRIEKLLLDLCDLREKKKEWDAEKNEMEIEVERLNEMWENAQESIAINEETILTLQNANEINSLKKENELLRKSGSEIKQKFESMRQDAENEIKTYRNEIIRQTQSFENKKKKCQQYKQKISDLMSEMQNLNEKIKLNLILEDKLNENIYKIEELLEENSSLVQQYKICEEQVKISQSRTDKITKDYKELELRYASQSNDLIYSNTKLLKAESENETFTNELNSNKENNSSLAFEIESLRKTINENDANNLYYEEIISNLYSKIDEKNNAINKGNDKINDLEKDLFQNIEKNNNLCLELEQLRVIENEYQNIVKEKVHFENEIKCLKNLNNDLGFEIDSKVYFIKELEATIEKNNEKHEQICKELNDEISLNKDCSENLQDELKTYYLSYSQIQDQLQEALTAAALLDKQKISLFKENEELKASSLDINHYVNEEQKLLDQIVLLKNEITTKEDLLDKLGEELKLKGAEIIDLQNKLSKSEAIMSTLETHMEKYVKESLHFENELKLEKESNEEKAKAEQEKYRSIEATMNLHTQANEDKIKLEGEKYNDLEANMNSLLIEKDTEISLLNGKLIEEKKQNDNYSTQLFELNQSLGVLLLEKENVEALNTNYTQDIKALHAEINYLKTENETSESIINQFRDELGSNNNFLSDKIVILESELKRSFTDLQEKNQIISDFSEKAKYNELIHKQLFDNIENLKHINSSLEEQLKALELSKETEMLHLQQELANSKDSFDSKLSNFLTEIKNLKENLSSIIISQKRLSSETESYKNEILKKLDDYELFKTNKNDEIRSFEKAISDALLRNSTLKAQLKQYENQDKSSDQDAHNKNEIKEIYEQIINNLRQENEEHKESHQRYKNELEVLKSKHKEILEIKSNAEILIEKLNEENCHLNSEIRTHKEIIEKLNREHADNNQNNSQAKQELEIEVARLSSLLDIALSIKPNENNESLKIEIDCISLDIIKNHLIEITDQDEIHMVKSCIKSFIEINDCLKSENYTQLIPIENIKQIIQDTKEKSQLSPKPLELNENYVNDLEKLKSQIKSLLVENKSLKSNISSQKPNSSQEIEDPDLNICAIPITIIKRIKVDNINWVLTRETDGNYNWHQESQLYLSNKSEEPEEDIEEIKTALAESFQGSIVKSIQSLKSQTFSQKEADVKECQTECIFGEVFGEISNIKDTPFVSLDFGNEFEAILTSEFESESNNSSNIRYDLAKLQKDLEKKTVKYMEKKRRIKLHQEQIEILKIQIREADTKQRQLESIDLNYLKNLFVEMIKGIPLMSNEVERIVKIFYKIFGVAQNEEENILSERKSKKAKNIMGLFR